MKISKKEYMLQEMKGSAYCLVHDEIIPLEKFYIPWTEDKAYCGYCGTTLLSLESAAVAKVLEVEDDNNNE